MILAHLKYGSGKLRRTMVRIHQSKWLHHNLLPPCEFVMNVVETCIVLIAIQQSVVTSAVMLVETQVIKNIRET